MSATDADELPEGWATVVLPDVVEINPSKPKAGSVSEDTPVTFVPMPAVDADRGAITNPSIRPFSEVRKGFTAFQDEDVILAKITPCMENGKAAVARGLRNGLGFGSTEFHVFRSNGAVVPDYVYHFIRQESFRRAAEPEMSGSVGQKRVPAQYLEGVVLPLPPLAEQQRIVSAVEALLAKVSAARDRLNRVPAILKRFRQSVLSAACSGRLTSDWREINAETETAKDLLGRMLVERRTKWGNSTPSRNEEWPAGIDDRGGGQEKQPDAEVKSEWRCRRLEHARHRRVDKDRHGEDQAGQEAPAHVADHRREIRVAMAHLMRHVGHPCRHHGLHAAAASDRARWKVVLGLW